MKDRRNTVDKLKTLLFGKDLRITKGDAYPSVYDYDFRHIIRRRSILNFSACRAIMSMIFAISERTAIRMIMPMQLTLPLKLLTRRAELYLSAAAIMSQQLSFCFQM